MNAESNSNGGIASTIAQPARSAASPVRDLLIIKSFGDIALAASTIARQHHMPMDEDDAVPSDQFERDKLLLEAAGVAQATQSALPLRELSEHLTTSVEAVELDLERLHHQGLLLISPEKELSDPPMLRNAGRQYLKLGGNVSPAVKHFLPEVIDDLHARDALVHGGAVLVDEFRYAINNGTMLEHAAELAPRAFSSAITRPIALDLYAAAIALMARLSERSPAGCVAEEILAVRLVEHATAWLETRRELGELSDDECAHATHALGDLYELFEDDDVFNLFEMLEPADAALASHMRQNQELGVVDQRLEAWFQPFSWTIPTGYLQTGDIREQ